MQITDLIYVDNTGYHFPDYPTVLAYLQDAYRAIYGADIYLEADSQDGQWLATVALALYQTGAIGASVFNSFSPVTAQGVGLSRNVKINGLNRQVPTNSTVDLTIVGQSGTVITNGIATDSLNQKWFLPVSVTIPGGGSIVVTATAELPGAVAAVAATITTIFTPTRGWQTVNNVAAATAGAPVETDAELRLRQQISTANPSLTVLDGQVGAVANLSGVTKVRGYENDTGSADANSIPAHSVSLIVVGGDDLAIAQTIAKHKTPGAGTYGSTSETVYDAHGMPLTISFGRGVTATISAEITISAGVGWSTDFIPLIQAAVAEVINSGKIGATVLITKLYAPAYLLGTAPGLTYVISLLRLKKNAGSYGTTDIALAYNENPVCVAGTNVTVIVT